MLNIFKYLLINYLLNILLWFFLFFQLTAILCVVELLFHLHQIHYHLTQHLALIYNRVGPDIQFGQIKDIETIQI